MEETPGSTARGRVEGKVAIVTGGGQVEGPGIGTGKAAAMLLARHGASVVLVDREPSRAEITKKEIEEGGGRAVVLQGDVADPQDAERMTRTALDEYGRLDILVNNVGVSTPGSVVDLAEATWNRMIDVNLKSVYLVSKYAIPAMAATGGGSVVNISSIGALRSIGFAAYSAAKGGMISLTQEMAVQHGRQGVRVNVVAPGSVQTPRQGGITDEMNADMAEMRRLTAEVVPLGQTTRGTGWDIGYAVLFLASDEASWITGQVLPVDGGLSVTSSDVTLLTLKMQNRI